MDTPEDTDLRFRVARQMHSYKFPSRKRTQGEKNEDAHIAMETEQFKNIMNLITLHTQEAYKRGYIAGGIVELTTVRGCVEYIHADTVNDRIIELEKDNK